MKSFHPICELPPAGTNFVYAPSVRSSFDILWGCLSVLVLCTWSIQHLNVPLQVTPVSKRQSFNRWYYRTLRQFIWMAFNLLAPEYTLGSALWNLFTSYRHNKRMRSIASESNPQFEWTLAHSFFANMGGFAIVFDDARMHGTGRLAGRGQTKFQADSLKESTGSLAQQSEQLSSLDGQQSLDGSIQTYSNALSADSSSSYTSILEAGQLEGQQSANGSLLELYSYRTVEEPSVFHHNDGFRNNLLHLAHGDDQMSLSSFAKRMDDAQSCYGETSWAVSEQNHQVVCKALRIYAMEAVHVSEQEIDYLIRNIASFQGNRWILDANQLLAAGEMGIIDFPNIESDEIENENKSDFFVKLLALFQIVRLCIQLGSRLYQHKPVSQLEIMTLSYSICSFGVYCALFYKPQGSTLAKDIPAQRYPTHREVIRLAFEGPCLMGTSRKWSSLPDTAIAQNIGKDSEKMHDSDVQFSLCIAAGGVIFGGLHLLAWNFEFPTVVEKLLWRICSLVTACAPVLMLETIPTITFFIGKPDSYDAYRSPPYRVAYCVASLVPLAYCLTRVTITVEAFRLLGFLPPEAFSATWASNAP